MTNEEIIQRIFKKLNEKAGNPHPCPVCGHVAWKVDCLYATLPLSPNPLEISLAGRIQPLIPLICAHCGNTQLINLLILGFSQEDLKLMGLNAPAASS
jgi:hypothetical protein